MTSKHNRKDKLKNQECCLDSCHSCKKYQQLTSWSTLSQERYIKLLLHTFHENSDSLQLYIREEKDSLKIQIEELNKAVECKKRKDAEDKERQDAEDKKRQDNDKSYRIIFGACGVVIIAVVFCRSILSR